MRTRSAFRAALPPPGGTTRSGGLEAKGARYGIALAVDSQRTGYSQSANAFVGAPLVRPRTDPRRGSTYPDRMLHEFLHANRAELIRRCRAEVGRRSSPPVTPLELEHGVPRFLEQLVEELRYEHANPPPNDKPGSAEGRRTANLDGDEFFEQGYSVGEVVHGYGDVCQVITELAMEKNVSVTVREFRTFNRLLDNAIADAVSSFVGHRESSASDQGARELHQKLGTLAEEQRRLIEAALGALDAVKFGNVGLTGATGKLLEDSLQKLRVLIDRSLPEVRLATGMTKAALPIVDRRALEAGRRLSDQRFAAVRKLCG